MHFKRKFSKFDTTNNHSNLSISMKKISLSVCLFLVLFNMASAQMDSQWRGLNRDGIYNETNLLKVWPTEGLKLLWSYNELGQGHSSPTITDDRVFISDNKDSIGYAYAFDLNGKVIWKTTYGAEWNDQYPGVRSTFTYYKNRLYLLSSYSVAICLDAATGAKIWEVDFQKMYGSVIPKFGKVESPLIYNDKIIFTPGGDTTAMIALNPDNGKVIWESKGIENNASYCSPQLIDFAGKKVIVNSLASVIAGFDADNGTILWTYPQTNKYNIHCNTPMYKDGYLYSVTGYGKGGVMLKLGDDGKSVTKVWSDTLLDNQMGGAILYNSMIVSSGHYNKSWYVLDWKTGAVKFTSKAIGVGAVIFADDHFYGYSDKGELALMKLTDNGLELVSMMKISLGTEQHWSHPVIRKGVLYLHHGNTLMAYSLKP